LISNPCSGKLKEDLEILQSGQAKAKLDEYVAATKRYAGKQS